MKTIDCLTFGETMVLMQPNDSLPLEYVHQFNKTIGGAESNVAIALQRLGHQVRWFSKLGADPFGRYILQFVRGEGVDTSMCTFTDQAPTGVFFKEKRSAEQLNVFYYRKHSAASLMSASDIKEADLSNTKILHLTGITPALSQSCKEMVFEAIHLAKKHNVKIVFDPNLRLKLWSETEARATFQEIVKHADLILPGLDEGEFITGETTPEAISEQLRTSAEQTVVIKLGANGAYYANETESGYVSGFPVTNLVDPVGAGDGFAAGMISGMLKQEPLTTTIKRANAIGAMVVSVNGDIEGLPRLAEVEQFMNEGNNKRDVNR